MGEGLSASEVGKEIAEHRRHHADGPADRRERAITVVEAVVLAVVAVLAAWSGYASAKWSTESRLLLAQASTARTEATRANLDAATTKDFDGTTFDAWFTAYLAGDEDAVALAERRFRPGFAVAFDAWMATQPFTNPDSPPGPTFMPQYRQPELARSRALDRKADRLYAEGAEAGGYADDYVRTTVYLATVLFLVGISGHFRVRGARIGLVSVAGVILTYAVVLLVLAPKPPG